MKRVLIGAPIRQDPEILSFYLRSLDSLYKKGLEIEYFFIDDNVDRSSKEMLSDFGRRSKATIVESNNNDLYVKDENTHYWNNQLISKVAALKNIIINKAVEENFDYLFLVDSDLVLQRQTLEHLVSLEKHIISEIFWTKWDSEAMEMPQVWLKDQYTLFDKEPGESITQEEANNRTINFIEMLRKPGVYEVGGLGALTLIHRSVLEAGVNFNDVKNISFWGEDRHFCVRAAVHGFDLFVDTHYPAFHIYRKSELEKFLR